MTKAHLRNARSRRYFDRDAARQAGSDWDPTSLWHDCGTCKKRVKLDPTWRPGNDTGSTALAGVCPLCGNAGRFFPVAKPATKAMMRALGKPWLHQ